MKEYTYLRITGLPIETYKGRGWSKGLDSGMRMKIKINDYYSSCLERILFSSC